MRCVAKPPGRAPVRAGWNGPEVAYTVSRSVGGAVERNRVRRRLRAAVAANADRLAPDHAYLFRGTREALTMEYPQIVEAVRRLLTPVGR
jgi:ribonuclease P protein component